MAINEEPPGPTDAVARSVCRSIALVADVPLDSIDKTTDLIGLGLDSLDFSAILVEIEGDLGEPIPDEILARLDQVGDIHRVSHVLSLLSGWQPRHDG